jgi:alpha-mannosidase
MFYKTKHYQVNMSKLRFHTIEILNMNFANYTFMQMKKLVILMFLLIIYPSASKAQLADGVFKCSIEAYNLLMEVSGSVASRGEILLSRTQHQDHGWIDEVGKAVIKRDTLWLTPYLERLAEDPGFSMDIEHVTIIKEYLNRYPEKKGQIQKGLDEGRILIGATYTQPYEDMYSGESLIRQLYLGKKWLADNFNGYESDTYYNSDVPGRTLQISQILAKADVNNVFASRHEKGVFDWYSPDGSKVTMFSSGHYIAFYHILAKENEEAIAEMAKEVLFWGGYYDHSSKDVIIPAHLNYEPIWDQKPLENCEPFMNLWNSIRFIENEKGERAEVRLPPFKYGTMDGFINAIRENSSNIRDISGERPNLWLYIHGPTHHSAISASRQADILLPDAEKFAAINALAEGNFRNYDTDKFNRAWEAKIYPDHGWGGKGGDITDRLFLSKFIRASNDATALLEGALHRLASKIDYRGNGVPLVVFNGLNWDRTDPVTFKYSFEKGEASGLKLVDADESQVITQLSSKRYYDDGSLRSCTVSFIATDVPSLGYSTYYIQPLKQEEVTEAPAFNPVFENRFFSVRFGKGGIEKLYDKTLGQDVIDNSKFNLGEVFTMRSEGTGAGEFFDIQQPSMEGFDKTGNYDTSWEKVADGPVYTSFRFRQPVRYAVVEQIVTIYNQKKQIDFEIDIKNWEGVLYREFRAAFPLNMDSPRITYEVPAGIVEVGRDELKGPAGNNYDTDCRLIHPRSMVDWVNASGSRFGATISSSVIAFDYIDPTTSPASNALIQPILFASRKSCHWEGNEYLQLGDHHFSFSLFFHEPGWENGYHEGKQGQNKLYAILDPVRAQDRPFHEKQSFLSIEGDLIFLSALKKSEDDNSLTIRLIDMGGIDQKVGLDMFAPVNRLVKTNLIEQERQDTGLNGRNFTLKMGKNSIETFKLIP